MSFIAKNVTVTAGAKTLVRDAALVCAPGEVVAMIGPNGAGKSTLLSALARRREAAGDVRLDGRALGDWPGDALARRRGVLSQEHHMPFGFSVREVVEMGLLPWRAVAGGPARVRTLDYLEAVGLRRFAHRKYPTLSGGEKRRVQLARVMVQLRALEAVDEARYLLLDEPLASLDIAESARVLTLIRRLADRGLGVVSVFHDLNAAASVADRVVLMRGGEIVAAGPPSVCLNATELEACFGAPVAVSADESGRPHIRAQLSF
ncbi:heme ABC transporter ATP-binding protein [Persicimonas caeni]|uniref:Heme ABC transporter ATP-binding protein n=1 Tax=Persicimonas caeni TaxID=2292766 RepID=A0A4Y6PRA3_PERCE|nr:heme ABC transporter ATP-binding protein [Persicimonas caeni]QDG50836.1 heme ABC transporter ATP-binding protein [Persicimonas caeni]QED32057.1 heme ABC transporter ATP-binding protein [Persicimonas caeni]